MTSIMLCHRCSQLGLMVAVIVALGDQFSKWYLLEVLNMAQRSPVDVTPFFRLVMVWNPGISFGMLGNLQENAPLILSTVGILLCMVLLLWLRRTSSQMAAWGLGMVLGGAVGNIVDRIRFGAVADFFDFYIGSYHWPAFNIADSAIFIGVVLLMWNSIVEPKNPEAVDK